MSFTGDWADWAGDNPVEAEAQLREEARRAERYAEHKRLAAQTTPDRDGYESAAAYAKDRAVAVLRDRLGLPEDAEVVVEYSAGSAEPIALHVVPPSTCETEGHEYDFGICSDCEQVDPDFEPTDEQITDAYLNRTFAA